MKTTYNDTVRNLRKALDLHEKFRLVRQSVLMFEKAGVSFDAVVCCGVSGMVFGTTLADRLQLPLVVVRKKEVKQPHSWKSVEGPDDGPAHPHIAPRYLFVDDLVASGNTYDYVKRAMATAYPGWRMTGMLLYDYSYDTYTAIELAAADGFQLFVATNGAPEA